MLLGFLSVFTLFYDVLHFCVLYMYPKNFSKGNFIYKKFIISACAHKIAKCLGKCSNIIYGDGTQKNHPLQADTKRCICLLKGRNHFLT